MNGHQFVQTPLVVLGKEIDGKNFTIICMMYGKLKRDAEIYLGETVKDAVITVPAYFNDIQRQGNHDAGRIAGLNVIRYKRSVLLLHTDWITGHRRGYSLRPRWWYFDVSIIEIGEGVIEALATNGDNHLGGDDFDDRITNRLVNDKKGISWILEKISPISTGKGSCRAKENCLARK